MQPTTPRPTFSFGNHAESRQVEPAVATWAMDRSEEERDGSIEMIGVHKPRYRAKELLALPQSDTYARDLTWRYDLGFSAAVRSPAKSS